MLCQALLVFAGVLAVSSAMPGAPYAGFGGFPYGAYYGGAHPYFYNGFPYTYNGFPYNYQAPAVAPSYQAPATYAATAPAPAPYVPTSYGQDLKYMGVFDGTCEGKGDGLYYVDERSFSFCSGGYKSIQACAEGSVNPPLGDFNAGKFTHYYDFCSVNVQASDNYGK